ncbi:amidohydrolase [Candidatus Fermentibacteria bacterium]|nr:MAG: amidohydrolase [Candidatus Fermentibacteria bacterium]
MERKLVKFRRSLHRNPELSGREDATSAAIQDHIAAYLPDNLITGLGGRGVAAEFKGSESGSRILLRCDMDALPINEDLDVPYSSVIAGVSHKCGHDGHTAIMMGVAARLHEHPPARGSVVLLFQPAEETGEGASRVIIDSKFKDIEPDFVFALHNLPGFPLGSIVLKNGTFSSASRGITVELTGASSHASEPQKGKSPALAVAKIVEAFTGHSQPSISKGDASELTVTHVRVGSENYGTSPGEGCILAVLRTRTTEEMMYFSRKVEEAARAIASNNKLDCRISWTDEFPVTENSPKAVNAIRSAAGNLGLIIVQPDTPFPWSEDFGHFTEKFPGALFGIGAGTDTPALHSSEYDFPDELIPLGADIFIEIVNELLNFSDHIMK